MMQKATPHILIVDDDESICKTLSVILQSRGYQTTTTNTAKEAIEKTKNQSFDIALIDIKLPDMKGTKLLAKLQETIPETIKIMITGYPSLKNAVEALNLGAQSYIMKPIDPSELLKTIKNKLEVKKQAEKINKEKLALWVQSQARKAQSPSFQEFLETTATDLADFGLTKNQAKIYISVIGLGVASASEIATLSKIRREEVYRLVPELEKQGIITRRLEGPRKFSAIPPETAIKILSQTKLRNMKEHIEKLEQKQAEITSKLKMMELPIQTQDCSTEIISQRENLQMKLGKMTQNAKQEIDAMVSLAELKIAYLRQPKQLTDQMMKKVKLRIITEKTELDPFTKGILDLSKANGNPIELRQIEKIPFNLTITDDEEAVWGDPLLENETSLPLWTNNPTQITILKTAFESLWQKAQQPQSPKPYTTTPKHHTKQHEKSPTTT